MGVTQALFSSLARMGEDIGQARVLDRAERLATRQVNTEMDLARQRGNLAERQFTFGQQEAEFQRGLATRQQQLYERQLQQQGWHGLPTPVKDASGNYSLVYYNIHSGERKAVSIGSAPPGTYEYNVGVAKALRQQFPDLAEGAELQVFGVNPYVRQQPTEIYTDLIQKAAAGKLPGQTGPARSFDEARRLAQRIMAESGAAGVGGARLFDPGAFLRRSGFINESNLPNVVNGYLKLDSNYQIGKLMLNAVLQAQMAGIPIDPVQLQSAKAMMDEATVRAYQQAKLPVPPYLQQSAAPAGNGMVKMRAPDGTIQLVPAAQVPHYEKLGATRVP